MLLCTSASPPLPDGFAVMEMGTRDEDGDGDSSTGDTLGKQEKNSIPTRIQLYGRAERLEVGKELLLLYVLLLHMQNCRVSWISWKQSEAAVWDCWG